MLRAQIISGGHIASGRQLATFIHDGMRAWVQLIAPYTNDQGMKLLAQAPVLMHISEVPPMNLIATHQHVEATLALARMALAVRKEYVHA